MLLRFNHRGICWFGNVAPFEGMLVGFSHREVCRCNRLGVHIYVSMGRRNTSNKVTNKKESVGKFLRALIGEDIYSRLKACLV